MNNWKRVSVFIFLFYFITNFIVYRGWATENTHFTFIPNQLDKSFIETAITTAKTSIFVEAYLLSDKSIIYDLIKAHRKSVRVQVVLDFSNAYSKNSNEYAYQEFLKNGISVRKVFLSPNIDHIKWIDIDHGSEIISGSMNYRKGSFYNHDGSLLIYHDPKVSQWVEQHVGFRAKQQGEFSVGGMVTPMLYKKELIISILQSHSLFVHMNIMTDRSVVNAIIKARKNKIKINVELDASTPFDRMENYYAISQFKKYGIPLQTYHTTPTGYELHEKIFIINGKTVFIGSSNATSSGFYWNDELDWKITSLKLAQEIERYN